MNNFNKNQNYCKNNVGAGVHHCSKIKFIAGILIGMILAGGIGAFAEYKYMATEIKYTNEKSVSQALNELYGMKTNLDTLNSSINQTDATASDILSGKKAYTKNNGLVEGTFNKIYASGYTACNSSTGVFEVRTLNFRPSTIIIYNNSTSYKAMFIYDNGLSSCAMSDSAGKRYFPNVSGAITLYDNGFSSTFSGGYENQSYYWIAIK